ncbi:MAG TPA: DUF4123 domain-containing protein [Pyrinomonadaceae bacterium]|jgi:hypothetical protein|nr:DUF4123 domain-containing protein [Pyrinomonadaceae bacterium]
MKTEELKEALSRQLFSEEAANVYAVLDGAAVDELLDKLYTHEPEYECLYRGELEPDMAEVAPYLVCLRPDAEFTLWLFEQGWGQNWGIFVVTDADMRTLRRHFRTFLIVYDADGKPLYFRYYDPRVLRLYLPTCNDDELETIFGPVVSYLLEDEDPQTLLRFRKTTDALNQERLRLDEI